jgi:hypothetical protein
VSDRADYKCVDWFSEAKAVLEYTLTDPPRADEIRCLSILGRTHGCGIKDGKVWIYTAENGFNCECDTVIEKVHSSTIGEGWAVWKRDPEWHTYIAANKRAEYRIAADGGVEYRKKDKNV